MVGTAKRSWGVVLPWAALLIASVGCGGLEASIDSDDEGGAFGDTETGVSTGLESWTGTDETGPGLDTDDDQETADTADTGPDTTAGTGESPTDCELACGGIGECQQTDEGPTCICPKEFASTGLDCIPCQQIAGGDLPADVPAIEARFTFTVAGLAPPLSAFEAGDLFLHNTQTGDVAELGRTTQEQTSRVLIPGVYDVFYRLREGGSAVPINSHAKVATIDVLDEEQSFAIDIPVATIAGSFTVNEGVLDDAAFNYGRIWLVNEATGDRALLGDTRAETFSANVVPGSYAVHYEARESQGSAPVNLDARIGEVVVSPASEVVQELQIDIPVTTLSGVLTIDGDAVSTSLESGSIQLRDVRTGDRFELGRTKDVDYATPVIPGEYEVFYTASAGGVIAPVNTDHMLSTLVVRPGDDMTLDVDVPTVPFEGEITIGGSVPPSSNSDDAVLLLRGMNSDVAYLGNTNPGTFARRVIPGEYTLFYAQETAGTVMPTNTNAAIEAITLEQGDTASVQLDIPAIEVSGALTLGGNEAPDSPYDDGRIYLRNAETGDSVLLGNTRLGTYAARVVPGTYDVVYESEFSDGVMPLNRAAVLEAGLSLSDTSVHDIDIDVTSVVGAITVAGSPAQTTEGIGELYLRDVAADDLVYLGHTGAPSFEHPVLGGRYLIEYHGVARDGETLGLTLPANQQSVFACFDIVSD